MSRVESSCRVLDSLSVSDVYMLNTVIVSKKTVFYRSRNLKVFLADFITCDHIVYLTALSLNFEKKRKVYNIIIFQTSFRHKNVMPSRRFLPPQKLRIRFFWKFLFSYNYIGGHLSYKFATESFSMTLIVELSLSIF